MKVRRMKKNHSQWHKRKKKLMKMREKKPIEWPKMKINLM